MLLILSGLLFSVAFYYYCIRPMSYWKNRGVKQGNPTWLFGDNLNIMLKKETFPEAVVRLYNQHPKERYSGIYQLLLPTLVIKDSELIKQITVKDFEHFVDHRSLIPEDVEPLWSRNLFALRGQRWREMRSVLSSSFTSSKMKTMFGLVSDCAETFIEYLKNQKGDVLEVETKDVLTRYGNDVIASVAFGIQTDSFKDKNNQFYLMGKEITEFSGLWKTFKFLGYSLAPKIYEILKIRLFNPDVIKFFTDLIDQTIKLREEKGIVRPDMINLLLEARKDNRKQKESASIENEVETFEDDRTDNASEPTRKNITNMDIAAQALTFIFAGFESVATQMAFMAYELATNPDIQRKLRTEVVETSKECNGKLTYEALMKMKYMEMVISESLRKWPNAIAVDRICTRPYTIPPSTAEEKPLNIEKGELIWLPVYGFHHDPKYFPEPEKFDPERFNDENKRNINPYTYLPFGIGPRICIASRFALMESKTLFYHLLLHFELVPIKKTIIPLKISKKAFNLQAEGRSWLGFKPIKNSL